MATSILSLPPPFLELLLLNVMYDREYFLGQSWSTVLAVYPPTSCRPTAVGAEPQRCAGTAQQKSNHCYVINSVSVTNLKHLSTWAAVKKIPSFPSRSTTAKWSQLSQLFLIGNMLWSSPWPFPGIYPVWPFLSCSGSWLAPSTPGVALSLLITE